MANHAVIHELQKNKALEKEKRLKKIVELGEVVHKNLLKDNFNGREFLGISAQILAVDQEIYRLSKAIIEQHAINSMCTKCQQPIDEKANFCGRCGQENQLLGLQSTELKKCTTCNEMVENTSIYCPCCGSNIGWY